MSYQDVARARTYGTLGAAVDIATGGGTRVYGFIVSNSDTTNARTFILQDKDGNAYLKVYMPAGSNFESGCQWLADAGLTVTLDTLDADVLFTVFHNSAPGAA
jgi:hypothetical protein